MIAAEGMRLRACALFYFVPYTGGRHLRHLHRRSIRCYSALIAVLGRALSTSYAPLRPASACAVSVVGLHGHIPHLQLSSDAQARLVNVLSDVAKMGIEPTPYRNFRLPAVLPLNYSAVSGVVLTDSSGHKS